jgi:hypothetical protein
MLSQSFRPRRHNTPSGLLRSPEDRFKEFNFRSTLLATKDAKHPTLFQKRAKSLPMHASASSRGESLERGPALPGSARLSLLLGGGASRLLRTAQKRGGRRSPQGRDRHFDLRHQKSVPALIKSGLAGKTAWPVSPAKVKPPGVIDLCASFGGYRADLRGHVEIPRVGIAGYWP